MDIDLLFALHQHLPFILFVPRHREAHSPMTMIPVAMLRVMIEDVKQSMLTGAKEAGLDLSSYVMDLSMHIQHDSSKERGVHPFWADLVAAAGAEILFERQFLGRAG